MDSHCFCAYANTLEVIPYTLAKKAGLKPIEIDWDGIEEGARRGKCRGRHRCEGRVHQRHVREEPHPTIVDHDIRDQAGNDGDCVHDFEGETGFRFSFIATNGEWRYRYF
jgi:hypothetical protein